MMSSKKVLSLASLVAAALAVSGCGSFSLNTKGADYRSASAQPARSLEVPPDLTSPTTEDRFVIPANRGSTTFSTYNRERSAQPIARDAGVLPKIEKASVVRSGDQRWLVVNLPADRLWPVLKEFWTENGFVLKREMPEVGVMETDWAENRANIPQDVIRRSLGKVIDGLYSTPERDKFRTRIEQGKEGTEIYISHRGMMEVYATEGKDKTVWQPRPADPELEAEMLRRLMLRFGVEEARADKLIANPQSVEQARIVKDGGAPALEMDEGFDRAWRRVGLALDRVGFAVEDRDRSKGVYYVRYIDPDIDNDSKRDEGMFAKLAFWRSKKPQTSPQLQIVVAETGDKSRVTVTGADGKAADAGTQNRIVNLLYKELK